MDDYTVTYLDISDVSSLTAIYALKHLSGYTAHLERIVRICARWGVSACLKRDGRVCGEVFSNGDFNLF